MAAIQVWTQVVPQCHTHPLTQWRPCREGVVLKSSRPDEKGSGGFSFLDVGLDRMAFVAAHLPVHARVTVNLGEAPVARFVPEYSETMVVGEVI